MEENGTKFLFSRAKRGDLGGKRNKQLKNVGVCRGTPEKKINSNQHEGENKNFLFNFAQ
jgi:hypothetical protein